MIEREKLKISTRVMYDELIRQKAPVTIIDARASLLEYTDTAGKNHYLFSTASDKSASVGSIIGMNKLRTGIICKRLGLPVPSDSICDSYDEVLDFFLAHENIVLKPLSSSGGNGVSTNITDLDTLLAAYEYALEYGDRVIAQQHIDGSDVRMLVIAGNFRSAVERRPASVVGDGTSTIRELIDKENSSGTRFDDSMSAMSLIDVHSAKRYLSSKFDTIPTKATVVPVVGPANLSRGGTAHEATHLVTPEMIADAEKICRNLGLAICGVDMMWDKVTNQYYVIEINSTPGVNMHNDPFWGTSSNAIEQYVTWLLDPAKQMNSTA